MADIPDMFRVERIDNPQDKNGNSMLRVMDMGTVDTILNTLKKGVGINRQGFVDTAFAEMMNKYIGKRFSPALQETFRGYEQAFQEAKQGNTDSLAKKFGINLRVSVSSGGVSENTSPTPSTVSVTTGKDVLPLHPTTVTGALNAEGVVQGAVDKRDRAMKIAMNV